MSSEGAKPAPTGTAARPRRRGSFVRAVALQAGIVLLCAVGLELFLRVADFRDLRLVPESYRLPYEHDAELGWIPIAHKVASDTIKINSLGLRDIEVEPTTKPTILVIGDSFVYGAGVKDGERFTDRLRDELPGVRIVNAGVAAYGTDQSFLLMRRLWPRLEPSVVVLIVCVDNDHHDNSTNSVHGHTLKPYLAETDGRWEFRGMPVPRNHTWYYYNNALAERSALVRLGIEIYLRVRHPPVVVPDPTAQLVTMMRDYVVSHGAKFVVGLQRRDPALEPHLRAEKIPYASMDDADTIPNDGHWSPQGNVTVAERLIALLSAEKAIEGPAPRP